MDGEEAPASSPFAPRLSLARTPPTGLAPPHAARLQDEEMALTPPVQSRPPRPPPPPPSGQKRPLTSPEERRPVEIVRLCRPVPPDPSPAQPAQTTPPSRPRTPEADPSQRDPPTDSEEDCEPFLAKATKIELLDRVHKDLASIMSAATGPVSRLNKDSMNAISLGVQDTLAVVAALSLRLCEMEAELGRANARCADMEKEVLLSRSAGVRSEQPAAGAALTTRASYSSALKLPRNAEPMSIPPVRGPVLSFYPAEDQVEKLKTADDTKAELKRTVDPRALDVQVEKVRKVGNAGVVVQTTSPGAADRLKKAVPPTLRVSEPRKILPRICLRDIDGNPTTEDFLADLQDQNLRDSQWTLEKLRAECKVFKMTGRQHNTTTMVLECSPALREHLFGKDRIYIRWQATEACDFVRVTCCNKCQTFGHPEKYCKAKEAVCGKCSENGHKKETKKPCFTRTKSRASASVTNNQVLVPTLNI